MLYYYIEDYSEFHIGCKQGEYIAYNNNHGIWTHIQDYCTGHAEKLAKKRGKLVTLSDGEESWMIPIVEERSRTILNTISIYYHI